MGWTGCERKDDEEHTNCFTQDYFNVDLRDSAAKQRKGTQKRKFFFLKYTPNPHPHTSTSSCNNCSRSFQHYLLITKRIRSTSPKHHEASSNTTRREEAKNKRGRWHEQQQQQSFVACFSFVRTKKGLSSFCLSRLSSQIHHKCTCMHSSTKPRIHTKKEHPQTKKKRRRCPRE